MTALRVDIEALEEISNSSYMKDCMICPLVESSHKLNLWRKSKLFIKINRVCFLGEVQ